MLQGRGGPRPIGYQGRASRESRRIAKNREVLDFAIPFGSYAGAAGPQKTPRSGWNDDTPKASFVALFLSRHVAHAECRGWAVGKRRQNVR
jgi:hypothetical protein